MKSIWTVQPLIFFCTVRKEKEKNEKRTSKRPLLLGIEALTVLSIWGIGLLYQLPTEAFRLALAVFLLEAAILLIMWRNAKGRTSPSLREGWLIYWGKAFQSQLPVFALALLSLLQSGLLQFFVWHVLILSHSILFLSIFYGVQLRQPIRPKFTNALKVNGGAWVPRKVWTTSQALTFDSICNQVNDFALSVSINREGRDILRAFKDVVEALEADDSKP